MNNKVSGQGAKDAAFNAIIEVAETLLTKPLPADVDKAAQLIL